MMVSGSPLLSASSSSTHIKITTRKKLLLSGRCIETHSTPSYPENIRMAGLGYMFFYVVEFLFLRYDSIDFCFDSATETSTCFPGENMLLSLLGTLHFVVFRSYVLRYNLSNSILCIELVEPGASFRSLVH